MNTTIYMVRHGQSPKTAGGHERTRGLTAKGEADTVRITELLREESIGVFYSSPYRRAVLTLAGLAEEAQAEILVEENLRELAFGPENQVMPDEELYPLVRRMFREPEYVPPGGEALQAGRERAAAVLAGILQRHGGQKIAIGTHGLVMTLMIGAYDSWFDLDFLLHTSKPDVYRLDFQDDRLEHVERLWSE